MKSHKQGAAFSKPRMLDNYRNSIRSIKESRNKGLEMDAMPLPQESPTGKHGDQFSPLKLIKNDPALNNKQLSKPKLSSMNVLDTE